MFFDPLPQRFGPLAALLGLSEVEARALLPTIRRTFARGGVLGVSRGGQRQLLGLRGVPETGSFELASVTKPFTAALAGVLAEQGRLDWQAPLAALGGPLRHLPRPLTPYALATHTAGLPPHPARMALTTLTHYNDPYGTLRPADVLASARRWARPSGSFAYSNLGAGVLALGLAHAAGEDLSAAGYERALRREVTLPLGLVGVGLTPLREAVRPYTPLGAGEYTHFAELAGAGGLFGSAAELLRFGEAHLRGELGGGWDMLWAGRGLPAGLSGVSPGWLHAGGAVWHDGTARGTRTALGFSPRSGLVVTLLIRGASPLQPQAAPKLLLRLLRADD